MPDLPKPKGHFLLGNTTQFASSTIDYIENLQKEFPEKIAASRIAFRDFVFVLHPKLIHEVLQTHNRKYVKSFAYDGVSDFLGKGLLTNEGDSWLSQRRLIQPAFQSKAIGLMATAMKTTIQKTLDLVDPDSKIHLQNLTTDLAANVLNEVLFGNLIASIDPKNLNQYLSTFREHASNKLKNPFYPPLWFPSKKNLRFKSSLEAMHHLLDPVIEKAQQSEGHSLIHQLCHTMDAETKERMNTQQVFDEIITLYIAGQETTSNALVFTLWLLSKHPETVTALRESTLEYRHVISESLRLYPTAWAMSRECIESHHIGDHKINKGDTVFLSIYAMHRDPDEWESAVSFQPQRFESDFPKSSYLPFGAGPRICIGQHLALMEMEMVLKEVITRWDINIISPNSLDLITPMTLCPKETIWAAFSPHS